MKHIWYSIAKRSHLIFAVLLLGLIVCIIWILSASLSNPQDSVPIGIAAISAVFAAFSAVASLVQAVEIQRQREGQERPYIISYFDPQSSGMIDFVIENCGNSPALDVQIKFEPVPVDYQGRLLSELSLFKSPIKFMPPRIFFRQRVNVGYNLLANNRETKYTVILEYRSLQSQLFKERTEIDIAYMKQLHLPSKSVDEQIGALSASIKDLSEQFRSVIQFNSLAVETPVQRDKRIEKIVKMDDKKPKWKNYTLSFLQRLITFLD